MTRHDLVVTRRGLLFGNRRFACTVGRSGITAQKREGDGATPAGVHRLVGLLYRPDRLAAAQLPGWAVPLRMGDGWSDDPEDEDYNLIIRRPHPYRHERLWRSDPMYDLILLTGWNWPYATRGAGSAIFVHSWREPGHATAGCVALARDDLMWIANRIRHQSRLVVQPA